MAVIKQVLGWMLERTHATSTGRTLVVGTLPGERHELGALLAATAAGLEGWRVIFMGEDLPPEEILLTSRAVGASAVGISVVNPADRSAVWDQIHTLLQGLPAGIPLFLGGNAASDLVPGSDGSTFARHALTGPLPRGSPRGSRGLIRGRRRRSRA